MNKVYTFRLDANSRQRLQQLADKTYHSPAQLLRYLIDLAFQNPHLVLPEVGILSSDSNTHTIKPVKNDSQEG